MVLVAAMLRQNNFPETGGGCMKTVKRNHKIWLIMMSLLVLVSLPVVSSAQGRGRGQQKKHDRFVNGHDARDGRWDGKGPQTGRRTNVGNEIWRHRQNRNYRDRLFTRNERYGDQLGSSNNNATLRARRLRIRNRRNRTPRY
jgi:hypothetical protein